MESSAGVPSSDSDGKLGATPEDPQLTTMNSEAIVKTSANPAASFDLRRVISGPRVLLPNDLPG